VAVTCRCIHSQKEKLVKEACYLLKKEMIDIVLAIERIPFSALLYIPIT
jgi:hypothetical protein